MISRSARLFAVAVLAVLPVAACSSEEPLDLPAPADFEVQLLDQINAVRVEAGVARLTLDTCVADAARERAAQLPGAEEPLTEPLPDTCGDWDYAGENVSRATEGPAEVVALWESEPIQQPNLVDAAFEVAGVGCVGVSKADLARVAEPDEEIAGMACSVVFMGYQPAEARE